MDAFDSSSPYYLYSLDQPGHVLVTQPLNGNNYAIWSRAITMALEAKNKLGFIDGNLLKPEPNNANFSHRVCCNSMAQSWLIHSTIPTIANSPIWIISARDIWLDLLTHFTQKMHLVFLKFVVSLQILLKAPNLLPLIILNSKLIDMSLILIKLFLLMFVALYQISTRFIPMSIL